MIKFLSYPMFFAAPGQACRTGGSVTSVKGQSAERRAMLSALDVNIPTHVLRRLQTAEAVSSSDGQWRNVDTQQRCPLELRSSRNRIFSGEI